MVTTQVAEEYEVDVDYLLNEDPDDQELLDAVESLADTTYRNVTEWKMAIRSEDSVDRIEGLGEKAAQAAYLLERIQSEWTNRNIDRIAYDGKKQKTDLSEPEKKINQIGEEVLGFATDAGTQKEFLGKENRVGDSPDEINYGDFCLISGDNVELESVEREYDGRIETIERKFNNMHSGMYFDVGIEEDADLAELEQAENMELFEL
ncbi:MAG: hypothetical protein BRC26_04265 [Nanohaloarchaea archaeon QH_8_44_6]|nr:MAG: hypothetical protein BRC26_04265 [Nanohaloarchaea archaeon QH_8_44_6]